MPDYAYPLRATHALVERVDEAPPGVAVRRWVLRDDNQQHYHGRVALREDPLFLELFWKPSVRGREQRVGLFRLHLGQLLDAGYVRRENDAPDASPSEVRLRFYRSDRGVVVIQTRDGEPALPIGGVDRLLD